MSDHIERNFRAYPKRLIRISDEYTENKTTEKHAIEHYLSSDYGINDEN